MADPEIWRLIPGVKGLLASSRGRVMVTPRIGRLPNGGTRQYGGSARTGAWDGDRYIFAWKGKTYKVARLVCEAFHGRPPFSRAVCMHRDENARNNLPSNLVWGTQKENLNAPGFIAYCKSRTGENSPTVKFRKKAFAMSRHLINLNSTADRARATRYMMQAPFGTRVEFKAERRSLPQNDRMWAMLTDIAAQKDHAGRKYTPDQWKILFMHACGREVQFIPSLDGSTFIPWGQSSRDLSKGEMSDLIDFMQSWCAEHGVVLHDEQRAA